MMRTATRPADADVGIETPSNPLLRYARWQMRDFITQRATVLMLVAVLMLYPLVAGIWDVSRGLEQFAREMRDTWIYVIFGAVTALATLLGMRGIVADDRQQGYHRFLFSKPISVVRFYAQAAAVQAVGLFAVLALIGLVYGVTIAPFAVVPAFIGAGVFFVMFGGLTFLFSTLTRLDWVATLGSMAGALWVGWLVNAREQWWLAPISWVLPPLHAFGRMIEKLAYFVTSGSGSALADALFYGAQPLLYGAAAFGAGLWILKKRSVAR